MKSPVNLICLYQLIYAGQLIISNHSTVKKKKKNF